MQTNYEWITYSRARVLRELAAFRSEREIAERLGISYISTHGHGIDAHFGVGASVCGGYDNGWRDDVGKL